MMRKQSEIVEDIETIKKHHLEVCIFGCGHYGRGAGYEILKFLGIDASFYCDNNTSKWGKIIKDGIQCVSPEVLSHNSNIACFAMVGSRSQDEIVNQLKGYHVSTIITYCELESLETVIKTFIERCSEEKNIMERKVYSREQMLPLSVIHNVNSKKYVVYTCIVGDYDQPVEPKCISEECDYYLISDKKPENLKVFQWIDINEIVPDIVADNFRKNRFCKLLVHRIFPEHRYSVYVDGNIQIMGDIRKYADRIGNSGIAVYELAYMDDLYEHALHCTASSFDKKDLIMSQMDDYYKEGMPRHFGMFECTILVRDNQNPVCHKLMEDWWNEVFNRSYRDQLSFTYCLWKNGLEITDVGVLGNDYRNNDDFRRMSDHHRRGKS